MDMTAEHLEILQEQVRALGDDDLTARVEVLRGRCPLRRTTTDTRCWQLLWCVTHAWCKVSVVTRARMGWVLCYVALAGVLACVPGTVRQWDRHRLRLCVFKMPSFPSAPGAGASRGAS